MVDSTGNVPLIDIPNGQSQPLPPLSPKPSFQGHNFPGRLSASSPASSPGLQAGSPHFVLDPSVIQDCHIQKAGPADNSVCRPQLCHHGSLSPRASCPSHSSGNIACQVGFPSGNSTKIAEERKREDSVGGSSPGRWPALTNPRTLKAVSPGHVGRVQDGRHIPPGARLRVLGDHLRQDLCVLFSMAETRGRDQSRGLHPFGKGQPLHRSLASS